MLWIVLAALRSRRSSMVALWLLACLVIAGAVAAPFDVFGARARVTAQDITDAAPAQRMIILSESVSVVPTDGRPDATVIDASLARMRSAIDVPSASDVTGLRVVGSLGPPVDTSVDVAYRSGACVHVAISGRCPNALGEVMVSRTEAGQLGVRIGDVVPWPTAGAAGIRPRLRVVGLYEPVDVADPYWGKGLFEATAPIGSPTADAMFVTEPTVRAYGLAVVCERTLVVTPATVADLTSGSAAFAAAGGVDALTQRLTDLTIVVGNQFEVDEDFGPLASRITADASAVATGVPVLAVELVVFGWFALFLVLRAIAGSRRGDVGLASLRGTSRSGMWRIFGPQNALPVLAAIPVGAVLGYLGARWLAGTVPAVDRPAAIVIAAAIVVVVVVGALVAAAVAEHRARRTPVLDLLRRTPSRRRGWHADAADAVVVAVAAFGIVQSTIGGTAGGGTRGGAVGVAAAAPALLGVAVALAAARLLAPIAARLIPGALRSGRTARLLTAAHVARRPGLDRVFALLVIASVLTGTAVLAWHTAAAVQSLRAVEELGADRVLQIRDANPRRVLDVTRSADPSGRYAMAAASYAGGNLLAVDSSRLAQVLDDGPAWPRATEIAKALRPTLGPIARFSDGSLTLDVTAFRLPARPVGVSVDLVDDAGTPHAVRFGPLAEARHRYVATVGGCPAGCTLVDLSLAEPPAPGEQSASVPVAGLSIVVSSLSARAGGGPAGGTAAGAGGSTSGLTVTVDASMFGDRSRWRTSFDGGALGPALATGHDGLHIDLPAGENRDDTSTVVPRVFPASVALPVPIVLAGALPPPRQPGVPDIEIGGDLVAPVRVAATSTVLPRLGTAGSYADLEALLRLDGGQGADAQPQIWLRADTPAAVLAKLRSAGLTIVSDTSTGAAEAAYQRQAPQAVLRFALAVAVIAMLAAITALATLASLERRARATELAGLRRGGLPARAVAATSYASYLVVAAGAAVTGIVAVIAAHAFLGGHLAVFADGYATPPAPRASASGWLWSLLAITVPLGLAAAYVAARLVRAVSGHRAGWRT